jgi:hypothetical protein
VERAKLPWFLRIKRRKDFTQKNIKNQTVT